MEVESKKEYGQLYNEGLYKPLKKDIMEEEELPSELQGLGIKAYNAGTDFKMMVRVIKNASDNTEQRWNNFNGQTKTDHMCVSYIRNDMQGTYAKESDGSFSDGEDLTFGFSSMDEESILYIASQDLGSYHISEETEQESTKNIREIMDDGIVSSRGYFRGWYTPDELIKKMMAPGPKNINHNELGYKRMQNGEIKEPDYIVVSVKDGIIDVQPELLMKAVRDWKGKLPIVIIDIDKCLEAERNKVLEMFQRYRNGEIRIEQDIIDKIRSNRFTESNFCSDVLKELNELRYGQNNQEIDEIQEKTNESISQNLSIDTPKEAYTHKLKARIETFCRYGLSTKGKDYSKAETLFKDECKALGISWLKEYESAYARAVFRKKCDQYYMLPTNSKTSAIKDDLKKRASRLGLDLKDEMALAEKRYWAITKIKGRVEKGTVITESQRAELEKIGLNFEVDVLGTLPIGINPKESVKSIATSSSLSRDVLSTQGEITKEYMELENPELRNDKKR